MNTSSPFYRLVAILGTVAALAIVTAAVILLPGGALTQASILDSLLAGRCFNTRTPGALLFISVNGALPGETAWPHDGEFRVEVRCQATRLIDRVELVGDGEVLFAFHSEGSMTLDATTVLRSSDAEWLMARAYLLEEPMPENGHTGTPLDLSGCVAFTKRT